MNFMACRIYSRPHRGMYPIAKQPHRSSLRRTHAVSQPVVPVYGKMQWSVDLVIRNS